MNLRLPVAELGQSLDPGVIEVDEMELGERRFDEKCIMRTSRNKLPCCL
jgi:hypothetical protein